MDSHKPDLFCKFEKDVLFGERITFDNIKCVSEINVLCGQGITFDDIKCF